MRSQKSVRAILRNREIFYLCLNSNFTFWSSSSESLAASLRLSISLGGLCNVSSDVWACSGLTELTVSISPPSHAALLTVLLWLQSQQLIEPQFPGSSTQAQVWKRTLFVQLLIVRADSFCRLLLLLNILDRWDWRACTLDLNVECHVFAQNSCDPIQQVGERVPAAVHHRQQFWYQVVLQHVARTVQGNNFSLILSSHGY